MMLSLKPSCWPSVGPEPYLLPHFSLQAISSQGSCCAHQAAWGSQRASSPARPQRCCQVVALPCSCGPDGSHAHTSGNARVGGFGLPAPALVFSILSLLWATTVPSKSLVCPWACSESSQHLYGGVSERSNYLSLVLQTNVCSVHFLKGKGNSGLN